MAFDRHLNLVLGDSEEFRRLPPKKGKSEEEVRAHRQKAPRNDQIQRILISIAEGGAKGAGPGCATRRGDRVLDN